MQSPGKVRATLVVSLCLGAWTGCKHAVDDSSAKDLFTADAGDAATGNARRRPATPDEKLLVVQVQNGDGLCTGHLLSPHYLMTAGHCQPKKGDVYTSGAALAKGEDGDLSVEKVVEYSPLDELDYAIVMIKWKTALPETQKLDVKLATKAEDVVVGAGADQGDQVFTVGFAADKLDSWGTTYASGQLKKTDGDRLYYNVGTINGNSGGAVWRKSDMMLVTLTNGGLHGYQQQGWDKADANSATAWNYGTSLWKIYAASKVLKALFPTGSFDAAAEAAFVAAGGGDEVTIPAAVVTPASSAVTESFLATFLAPSSAAAPGGLPLADYSPAAHQAGPGVACQIDGMSTTLTVDGGVVQTISLVAHLVTSPCTGTGLSLHSVSYRSLAKVQQTDCGKIVYEGTSTDNAPIQLGSGTIETTAFSVSGGGGGYVAPPAAGAVSRIHVEDRSSASCTPAAPANFVMTETAPDGTVTTLYGNRAPQSGAAAPSN